MASIVTNPADESQAAFIPWSWYLKPDNPQHICPSPTSILGTFGAVNAIVALLNLVFGHRVVINFITCGYFGKPRGSTWWFMFMVPLGIQLSANAFIAYLYKTTPGYKLEFTVLDLMLFYTTRPRLGWIVLAIAMPLGKSKKEKLRSKSSRYNRTGTEEEVELVGHAYAYTPGSATAYRAARTEMHGQYPRSYNRKDNYGWYEASAKGSIFAEIFLLLIASYYNGITVHFAATRGYYIAGKLQGPHAHDARIMYVGALMSLIFLLFTIVYLFLLLTPCVTSENIVVVLSIGVTTWLASWLFWGGYVHLAKDL